MNELEAARKEINRIDEKMAELFEARMNASAAIAEYKKNNGMSIRDREREKQLIDKNRGFIKSAEVESYYVRFIKDLINVSCEYQAQLMSGMRVAYCGVEGAFAHIAAKRMFPDAQLLPFGSFADAYQAVSSGDYDCAVLPLENSVEGEVGSVMDLVFSGDLYINQVVDLPVVHNLIGLPGASADGIKTVISHPQALGQCAEYIRGHGYASQTFSNTALAAKHVLELGDSSVAAIASAETAELFGLEVLDKTINDSRSNSTRFAALSRAQNRPASAKKREDESFILMFTVRNEAGSLAQTLNIIGAHGFNMRSLRSRPMKGLQWSYFFYAEAEGNINTENGRDMLRELSAVCAKLKLVGAYYTELKSDEY